MSDASLEDRLQGLPGRILVAQTAFLGDLVLSQPLVAALAHRFAPRPVDLLVRAPFVELARCFPGVGEVLVDDKRGAGRGLGGFLRLRSRLSAGGYALAVSPHQSFRTGLLLRSAGIPLRLGFARAPGAPFWSHQVEDPGGSYPDRLERFLQLLGAGGRGADPLLTPSASAALAIEEKLSHRGIPPRAPLAVLNPGSVWGTKRWLPEGYAELARDLAARGYRVVVSGGREDRAVGAEVARASGGAAVDLTGETTLPELLALAGRAALFVTGDSGPMHIAAAAGAPVIAIFGPTIPAMGFAPRTRQAVIVEKDLPCRPCHRHGPPVCPLGHFRCMREISAREVMGAVDRALRSRAA